MASSVSRFLFGKPVVTDSAVTARHVTALVARIALSAIFLISGFAKLSDPAAAIGYMDKMGVPESGTLVYVAGMAELLGGLAIMFDFFHDFWNLSGAEAKTQMVQFTKNLALMGGLLMLVASGAGRYSLDAIVRGGGAIAHDYRDPEALTRGVAIRHGVPLRHGV